MRSLIAIMLIGILKVVWSFGNGVNLQPSYFNNGNVTFGWSLMKTYSQIKSVRIEIEPDKVSKAQDWIRQARSQGYAVIATYHKYTVLGSDNTNDLNEAANWWAINYNYLKQGGDFTINVINEWGSHNQNSDSYANAYNSAISKIRSVYSGSIVIDVPGWGQETRVAAQASSKIWDKNIIISAHIYPGGWNQAANRGNIASDMDELKNTGRPCIVGEFGTSPAAGTGSSDVIGVVNRAKQNGFAVFAWAWNGDGGQLNMVSPTWGQNPTSSSYQVSGYLKSVIGLLGATCTDSYPYTDGYGCAQQASWGKCNQDLMRSPVCDKSCGRC